MRGPTPLTAIIVIVAAGILTSATHAQHAMRPQHDRAASRAQPMHQPRSSSAANLDSLTHSLRRVDPGNARFSPRAPVHRLAPNAPDLWREFGHAMPAHMRNRNGHRYRYEAPGVQAWMRRPEHVVRNGEMQDSIPPDTIFDLTPRSHSAPPRSTPAASDWVDRRINTRFSTRIDSPTQGPLNGHRSPASPQEQARQQSRPPVPEHVQRILRTIRLRRTPAPPPPASTDHHQTPAPRRHDR